MKTACKFTFINGTEMKRIEEFICVAILHTEYIFGKPRVRIMTSYYVSDTKPQCVIDISTEIGEHIATLFTGRLIREFGEEGFAVELVQKEKKVK